MGKILCPITGVNVVRLLAASVLSFAFIFGFEFIFHGIFLMDQYLETAALWRPVESMQEHFLWGLLAQFLFAMLTVMIYAKGARKYDIAEGLRFGILLGLLVGVISASAYVYMPLPGMLAIEWFAGSTLEVIVIGLIAGIVYKP